MVMKDDLRMCAAFIMPLYEDLHFAAVWVGHDNPHFPPQANFSVYILMWSPSFDLIVQPANM